MYRYERRIDMTDVTILTLLKKDLMISVDSYDDLLTQYIKLAKKDLEMEGITIQNTDEDGMLVEMYAAWIARKRKENIPMSRQLQFLIHNRLLHEKMGKLEEEPEQTDEPEGTQPDPEDPPEETGETETQPAEEGD